MWNTDQPCVILPDMLSLYGLVDFVQYPPALCDLPDLGVFIRSGGLCGILTGLVWFTRPCGLYMVLWSLYNINRACMMYHTCEKLPDLWALYGLIDLQTLCNIYKTFECLPGLCTFIRSCDLCIISTRLAWLFAIFTSLSYIYRGYAPYKVLRPLHNINRACMIYQTCEKLSGLWALYGLIQLQTLCNIYQPFEHPPGLCTL